MRAAILVVLAIACVGCAGGSEPTGASSATSQSAAEDRVIVRGTVLDAESAEPVAGAKVTAPNGSTAVSDAHGRFEFVDLPEELSGPLRAETDAGWRAENALRPLQRGVLEVVLRLRKP